MLSCVRKRRRDKKSGPRSIVTEQGSVAMDRTQTMKYHQTHCQLPLAIELWDQTWNREEERERGDYIHVVIFSLRQIVEERRKQLIQESKFLGGDMQHTHLVKGLDYVLLDKVRLFIVSETWQKFNSNLHLCVFGRYAVRCSTGRERKKRLAC